MKNTLNVSYSSAPVHAYLNSYDETLQALRTIINPENYCQQNVFVLLLNKQDGLLGWQHLNRGTADGVLIDMRLLVTLGSQVNAARIVLAHTLLHYTGGASIPVQEFIADYQPLSKLLNMPLKDYVLLTEREDFSVAKDELFPTETTGYNMVEA